LLLPGQSLRINRDDDQEQSFLNSARLVDQAFCHSRSALPKGVSGYTRQGHSQTWLRDDANFQGVGQQGVQAACECLPHTVESILAGLAYELPLGRNATQFRTQRVQELASTRLLRQVLLAEPLVIKLWIVLGLLRPQSQLALLLQLFNTCYGHGRETLKCFDLLCVNDLL